MLFPWLTVILVAQLLGIGPMPSAAEIARRAGRDCPRGCIVADDGWVYEVTRDDLVWTARAAHCEVESVIGTADADAAMWALVSNFVRRHRLGRAESFGSFVSSYSACTSRRWSSAGTRYSPRITPIADANRATRWDDLPQRTRDYVRDFLAGEIPNRYPGIVYVLTAGWERFADPRWIGPTYSETHGPGSVNAYYADPTTVGWCSWTVRIAPATED